MARFKVHPLDWEKEDVQKGAELSDKASQEESCLNSIFFSDLIKPSEHPALVFNRKPPTIDVTYSETAKCDIDDPLWWRGWLSKKSRNPLGRWNRHWFHLVGPPTLEDCVSKIPEGNRSNRRTMSEHSLCPYIWTDRGALLCYSKKSTNRFKNRYRVVDFQRERCHEDTKFCFAFTLTVLPLSDDDSHSNNSAQQFSSGVTDSRQCFGNVPRAKQVVVGVATIADAISVSAILIASLHPSLAAAASSIVREAAQSPIAAFGKLCKLKPLQC